VRILYALPFPEPAFVLHYDMNLLHFFLRVLLLGGLLLGGLATSAWAQSAQKRSTDGPPQQNNNLLPVPGSVYTPTAFTPNGDGQNDRFEVYMPPTQSFNLSIFARNGQRVFATNSLQPWDGTVDGKQLPMGVYFYVINATLIDGDPFRQKGYVMLIR